MSSHEYAAHAAVAHALTESAVAVAVRKVVGRVGFRGHPTQKHVVRRFRAFALGAANFALLDERMKMPDLDESGWRQRLADENAARLGQLFASSAFVERYVTGLLSDQSADVSSSNDVVREAFAHVFNVVTQVVRLQLIGADPMLLPQPAMTRRQASGGVTI